MDLTILANEGIPVKQMNQLAPEFNCFGEDSKLEISKHDVSSFLTNQADKRHRLYFCINNSELSGFKTYFVVTYSVYDGHRFSDLIIDKMSIYNLNILAKLAGLIQ